MQLLRILLLALCLFAMAAPANAEPGDDWFNARVTGILERRCLSCHNDTDKKGGLSLQTRESALRGGESGPALESRKPDASLLLASVSGEQPDMPKTGAKLTADEVADLRRWISNGAPWPAGRTLEERPAANLDWWSLKPIVVPDVPAANAPDVAWPRTPVDRFVAARLRTAQMSPSDEADRRTLIRRVTLDLTGLPPSPEDVAEFLADHDPAAYERLVDRLLASPRYGERWARHWLDVVHYGDTHGYDKDKPRPNAWPYRDYVVRAWNADKPYGRFVKEQIAGDVLFPGTADGVAALGFIAAGPWDFISHAEVPETKIDGKIARNLDRDDMVVNTLNTFCSATIQCARCHHHKFDPFAMEDYYRLQAVFAAVDRADKAYDADPAVAARRNTLAQRQRELRQRHEAIATEVRRLGGERLTQVDATIQSLAAASGANPATHVEYGYHSAIETQRDRPKWVQVDLGQSVPLDRITLYPCWDAFNNIGAGFGFPTRYKVEMSDDPQFGSEVVRVFDGTLSDIPNPGLVTQTHRTPRTGDAKSGPPPSARYVRVTATRLAPRSDDFIFSLAELEAWSADGKNVAAGKTVTALDSIEAGPRWGRANLVDGRFPKPLQAADPERLKQARAYRDALLKQVLPETLRTEQTQVAEQLAATERDLAALPPAQFVYAGTVHYGSGNFRGTGPDGGKPRPIYVLARGDVRNPKREVGPGIPPVVPGLAGEFELSPGSDEGARRAALAHWLTRPDHPLTWRSIVNRLWLYHFGRGIVDSPSDFGRMGQLPTHPELLDWLAAQLRDSDQSLKRMQRLIVTSSTYRQSSADKPEYASRDSGNSLLWRMNRRKLEAEAMRDGVLAVAGKLNLRMGGPGFQDFVVERPEHSPHYEYHLHDPEDPRTQRRSVYRFLVRSQPQPFMTTLDCADPSMAVDKRNETINALQALTLLNNKLTVAMARHFAERLEREATTRESQVRRAFELALGRPPNADEQSALVEFAGQHGLASACRVILNLNEFAFVD